VVIVLAILPEVSVSCKMFLLDIVELAECLVLDLKKSVGNRLALFYALTILAFSFFAHMTMSYVIQ